MPLSVVVALAVHAAPKAGFGKDLLFNLSLFAKFNLGLEDVDFPGKISRHTRSKLFFPSKGITHKRFSSKAFKFTIKIIRKVKNQDAYLVFPLDKVNPYPVNKI
jgi:hypothetical protein